MLDVSSTRHEINELEQEKIILEEFLAILDNKDSISKEIFDSMSHELRTPIVAIKGYTEMFLEGYFGKMSKVQEDKLRQIKINTDLLLKVIFEMLEKKNTKVDSYKI